MKLPTAEFMNRNALRSAGFRGFKTAAELIDCKFASIPRQRGIYLATVRVERPAFVATAPVRNYKGKDPSELIATLKKRWVKGSAVLYVGKSEDNLRKRIRQYVDWSLGKKGHHGGCYIWQLRQASKIKFCWRPTPDLEPSVAEADLIRRFEKHYGTLPFANRNRGLKKAHHQS